MAKPTREDFLIKMYETCWDNVSRAEDSLWKVFAAYTALFAGLGLAIDIIGNFGFLFVMTIFSFAGIISSIITNSWFVRNMGIISNIEKEFLTFTAGTINKEIIPKIWAKDKVTFLNFENWWIIVAIFFAIIIAIHVIMLDKISEEDFEKMKLLDVFGSIFVAVCWIIKQKNHRGFVKSAPGKEVPE